MDHLTHSLVLWDLDDLESALESLENPEKFEKCSKSFEAGPMSPSTVDSGTENQSFDTFDDSSNVIHCDVSESTVINSDASKVKIEQLYIICQIFHRTNLVISIYY